MKSKLKNDKTRISIMYLTIVSFFILSGCSENQTTEPLDEKPTENIIGTDFGDIRKNCESFNGRWLETPKECEGISETDCKTLGGEFFECESACRNNPKAEICTMQCIQVCKIRI